MPRTVAEIVEEIEGLMLVWREAPPEVWAGLLEELEQASPQLRYPDTGLVPDGETL
jgi:hypothetical protein